jgi:hypothetical protein
VLGVPFIGGRGDHGRCTRADSSRLGRQGSEEGAALACAAGDGVLLEHPGMMGGIEVVWFRGGQARGCGGFPLLSGMAGEREGNSAE